MTVLCGMAAAAAVRRSAAVAYLPLSFRAELRRPATNVAVICVRRRWIDAYELYDDAGSTKLRLS